MGRGRDFHLIYLCQLFKTFGAWISQSYFISFQTHLQTAITWSVSSNEECHLNLIIKGSVTSNSLCDNVLSVFISYNTAADLQELFQTLIPCISSVAIIQAGLLFICPINDAEDSSLTLCLFQEADELFTLCYVVLIIVRGDNYFFNQQIR